MNFDSASRLYADSEVSTVTKSDSVDASRPNEDPMGFPTPESTSIEWTDEKHSLYLSFMEASFINQLYEHEYSSCQVGSQSREHDCVESHPSGRFPSNGFCPTQFKVLQNGCWKKYSVRSPQFPACEKNDVCSLFKNPWIQHFRHHANQKQIASVPPEGGHQMLSKSSNLGGKKPRLLSYADVANQKKPTETSFEENFCSSEEVSDQNFTDDNYSCSADALNWSSPRKKEWFGSGSRDQVFPTGNPMDSEDSVSLSKGGACGNKYEKVGFSKRLKVEACLPDANDLS